MISLIPKPNFCLCLLVLEVPVPLEAPHYWVYNKMSDVKNKVSYCTNLISSQAIQVSEQLLSGTYDGFLLSCQILEADLR